ncbi:MAG: hypothetical protein ACFFCS_14355 [Candidatus Hodarchaeota archaeon]
MAEDNNGLYLMVIVMKELHHLHYELDIPHFIIYDRSNGIAFDLKEKSTKEQFHFIDDTSDLEKLLKGEIQPEEWIRGECGFPWLMDFKCTKLDENTHGHLRGIIKRLRDVNIEKVRVEKEATELFTAAKVFEMIKNL